MEEAKQTLPSAGDTRIGPAPGPPVGAAKARMPLISSSVCRILKYASAGGSLSSIMRRSILLITTMTFRRCCTAWRSSRSVFSITPSTASTTTTAASATRMAAVTSSEKFTWPGVSTRLMRCDLPEEAGSTSDTGVDLMLTPRSCSSLRVSV